MRVLEYSNELNLSPMGGPTGYLYNLNEERKLRRDEDIQFLQPTIRQRVKHRVKSIIKEPAYARIRNAVSHNDPVSAIRKSFERSAEKGSTDFSSFDAIHFHTTRSMFENMRSLDDYRGKVLLTSHSPSVAYKEYIEEYLPKGLYEEYKHLFDSAELFDEYAFTRADYVVFPCKGAEDPYVHTWDKYQELRRLMNVVYVPSGVIPQEPHMSRKTIRDRFGIPEDAFLVSFVGRHSRVKGYDFLIEVFRQLEDVYVICCGRLGQIDPPLSSRWIEVGWTNDPMSYVNASDLFVLPNLETYFDLVLLQVLSIGKLSLISATGGNNEFNSCADSGVFLHDPLSHTSFINQARALRHIPIASRREMEARQIRMYREKYSSSAFYSRYKEMLEGLLNT